MNRRQLFLSTAKGALAAALGAVGFRMAARAQSPTAVQFPDGKVLPTPTPPFSGFIQPNLVQSAAATAARSADETSPTTRARERMSTFRSLSRRRLQTRSIAGRDKEIVSNPKSRRGKGL